MAQRHLVTGGAGFLGSTLIQRLLREGAGTVVCLDNLSTGRRAALLPFADDPRFTFVEADVTAITDPAGDPRLAGGFDRIWHLACPASPVHYQRTPVATLRTAVIGTSNMLDLARHHGARLLHASTSEVYGDPDTHPQPESLIGRTAVTGPRACYTEGKRAAEALCHDHRQEFGTDLRVVRIFNTYGPGMASDDGRVIPTWLQQALAGQPLTLFGDGQATRSYCYVDDLIDGLVAVMDRPDWDGLPVNLGRPVETTLLELAQMIAALCGTSLQIRHLPIPVDDPQRRCPDITSARQLLNWEPTIGLDAGLERYVATLRAAASKGHPGD